MPDRTALAMVYYFDGTLPGLLCAVFESYTNREFVTALLPEDSATFSLYPTRLVETDEAHARRVFASLEGKLGPEGKELVTTAFCHADPEGDRDISIFRFICMGYKKGPQLCQMLGDPVVSRVAKMSRSVLNERHQLIEFLRFSACSIPEEAVLRLPTRALADTGGNISIRAADGATAGLAAVIEPKHAVLPMMASHFCGRFPEERFLIYDKTHRLALVYQPYSAQIIEMEDFRLPEKSSEEELAQKLWKGYYKAVAIKERINPLCRRTHMQKRFWNHMLEVADEL